MWRMSFVIWGVVFSFEGIFWKSVVWGRGSLILCVVVFSVVVFWKFGMGKVFGGVGFW